MSDQARVVAVISPWDNLKALVRKGFRVQTLTRDKRVMVWREDLRGEKELVAEVKAAGVAEVEVRAWNVAGQREE